VEAIAVELVGFEGTARRRRRPRRSPSPRFGSVVDRRIGGAAGEVLDVLGSGVDVEVRATRLVASARAGYDPVEHEHRFRATMHVPWSKPDLPVWLCVAELTPSTSALRLSLRSRRRVRYPWRYFSCAHDVLDELRRRVDAGA
jgi:hypothetical protein